MAFPTIPTVAAGRVLFTNQVDTSGTRTFPDLSSLTKDAGDLLIAVITTYQSSTNPQFASWGGGFTECSDQGSGTTMGIGVAYKWSTGSETGTFTVTQAATITGHASMCLMSIPLAHLSTAPECGTIANGTAAAADPGALNPAGWGTEDTLWISVVASGMTSGTGSWTATGTTAPANYGAWADSNKADGSTVGETEIAVSFRQLNAASEDVGAAGVDTSNARNSALLIAVRPAPPVHDATGDLAGPGSTVAGSASSATTRPSSGALAGPGAALSGTAARYRAHPTTGILAGPGAALAGAAERTEPGAATHAATGALAGPGAAVAGAASSQTSRPASGALVGPGAQLAGSAARLRAMAATGALVGPGAAVTGSASSATPRPSSGALVGPGAVVAGDAARSGPGGTTHDASGVLSAAGAILVGSASSATARPSSGALTGPGAVIAASAARYRAHATSGAISAAGAILVGSASSATARPSSGALTGPGAVIAGSAARQGPVATHDCSGALVAAGAALDGFVILGDMPARVSPARARAVSATASPRFLTAAAARRTTLYEAPP